MRTTILVIALLVLVMEAAMALNWTVESTVSFVRTYDGVTFSIGLTDQQCENEKSYFLVHNRTNNETFYSIAYAAFLAGKKIRLSYTADANGVHCTVDGIWVAE